MSDSFSFVIHGEAVGKERPRFWRGGHVYTPAKTKAFEEKVRLLALQARGCRRPFVGPVGLQLAFEAPRGGGQAATRVQVLQLDPAYGWVTGRPDVSNCLKAIEDALNGVMYKDDSQVALVRIARGLADSPCVVVPLLPGRG